MLNDRRYWNFHVGPEGCCIHVRNVSLTIPKGALEKERTISIAFSYNTSDQPKLPYNQLLVGPVVHCLPHGLSFKQPVTLSFDYNPEAVQESSKMLVLYRYTITYVGFLYNRLKRKESWFSANAPVRDTEHNVTICNYS